MSVKSHDQKLSKGKFEENKKKLCFLQRNGREHYTYIIWFRGLFAPR